MVLRLVDVEQRAASAHSGVPLAAVVAERIAKIDSGRLAIVVAVLGLAQSEDCHLIFLRCNATELSRRQKRRHYSERHSLSVGH